MELLKYRQQIWDQIQKRQNVMLKIKQNIAINKKRDAKSIKERSNTYDAILKDQINESLIRNKERKHMIKKQERLIQKQRKIMEERRLKEVKQNYDERIRKEIEKIRERESALSSLKQEEMKLVMKLQNSQETQSRAFAELESVIKAQYNKPFLKGELNNDLKS